MDRPDAGLLMQDAVYAGLDALRAAMQLDLAAYVHQPSGGGPQLFLGTPELGSMEPTEAMNLFTSLRTALEDDHAGDEILLFGPTIGLAVTTQGPASRGLHVIGRREESLGDKEREIALRLCRSVGAVCHALDAVEEPEVKPSVFRLSVEVTDEGARAEASITYGGELRNGTGEAHTPARAVAHAVVDALDASLKIGEATDGEIGGQRAVLVLLMDALGNSSLGAALCGEGADPLRATATATLEAASRLGRKEG
jgi:hypothetical protein